MFGIFPALRALSRDADRAGHAAALALVGARGFPGYRSMLDDGGATTLWESWFFSNDTFSHDHPMFSGAAPWLVEQVGARAGSDGRGGYSQLRREDGLMSSRSAGSPSCGRGGYSQLRRERARRGERRARVAS